MEPGQKIKGYKAGFLKQLFRYDHPSSSAIAAVFRLIRGQLYGVVTSALVRRATSRDVC
jgi:hypothetical protein